MTFGWALIGALCAAPFRYKLHERLDCASKQFIYSLNNATLSAVHHDSHFEVLTNGSQFYPAMLEAIRAQARHSINMECYIFRARTRQWHVAATVVTREDRRAVRVDSRASAISVVNRVTFRHVYRQPYRRSLHRGPHPAEAEAPKLLALPMQSAGSLS